MMFSKLDGLCFRTLHTGHPSDSWCNFADIATVIEGQLHVAGSRQLPYGGQDVNQHLRNILQKRGVPEIDNTALSRLKESCMRLVVDGAPRKVSGTLHRRTGLTFLHTSEPRQSVKC